MFRAYTATAASAELLARQLEAHLNEYASEVVSVSYSVEAQVHRVLAVYVELETGDVAEAALAAVEEVLEEADAVD